MRILVVGAGIAGLSAARTLSRTGADVSIVDRVASPPIEGTGIYLPGNAIAALSALGLRGAVETRAVRIERQRFLDSRGRSLFEVDLGAFWADPCLAMPRAHLHQALLDGASTVQIRWGRWPARIDTAGSTVDVVLNDGTEETYDLVIGADGVHSGVRTLAFGGVEATRVGQYGRRFVVVSPDFPPEWTVLLGRGSAFLAIPIGSGQVYCYCDNTSTDPEPPLGEVFAGYAEPVPTMLAQIRSPEAVHSGPVEEVALDSWVRGRVVLIGDAAHATSPNMAEGAALAMEDALVLADCFGAAHTVPEALAAYEARRRSRVDWVRAQTHRRDRLRGLPAAIRGPMLRWFGRGVFESNYRPLRTAP